MCICIITSTVQLFPEILKVIPQSIPEITVNGMTIRIDPECELVFVGRNTRYFQVRACKGNNSILTDGEFNVTDRLRQAYVWDNRQTPEDPFLLYNFETPVIITRIVVTFFIPSQNRGAGRVPTITMFVSNNNSSYPSQRISVTYDDSDAPDTGVYQLELIPVVSEPFKYWCVDMEPNGTNWVIVSEVTLYQELPQAGKW